MSRIFLLCCGGLGSVTVGWVAPCTVAPLSTYLNSGNYYECSLSSSLKARFNHDVLPSYAAVALLAANNSSIAPANITVTPNQSSLSFTSGLFLETSTVLSNETELIHFSLQSDTGPITSTTFSLLNPVTSRGTLGIGSAIAIGQELVCVGGNFTSLPVGLVTSVSNGVLGTGQYGCNGTVLVGTAAISSGPLSAITNVLAIPNLTGVTDTATIQLTPTNQTLVDVIKLQSLISVTGGRASTQGFMDTFVQGPMPPTVIPEPTTGLLVGAGCVVARLMRRRKFNRET